MNIGVTGKFGAGKGEVARILIELGFSHLSLSDVIRDELRKEGKETSWENLLAKGNQLRETLGPGILGLKIKGMIKDASNVIDSIRNPYEVEELRQLDDFHLLGVDAPIELRFNRLHKRGRPGDVKSLYELKEAENKQNIKIDTNQQLDRTLAMSDVIIINDGSVEELKAKVLKIVEDWKNKNA